MTKRFQSNRLNKNVKWVPTEVFVKWIFQQTFHLREIVFQSAPTFAGGRLDPL